MNFENSSEAPANNNSTSSSAISPITENEGHFSATNNSTSRKTKADSLHLSMPSADAAVGQSLLTPPLSKSAKLERNFNESDPASWRAGLRKTGSSGTVTERWRDVELSRKDAVARSASSSHVEHKEKAEVCSCWISKHCVQ